jgi:NAD(P)-dependent dehydrogenase (short-subunit alcohol dehydrogenase family)
VRRARARRNAAQDIAAALDRIGLEPDVVVNNACSVLTGAADKLDRAKQIATVDLNVRGLTELSLLSLDALKRRRGGFLNVASLAGFMLGPVGPSIAPARPMYSPSARRLIQTDPNIQFCAQNPPIMAKHMRVPAWPALSDLMTISEGGTSETR